MSNKDIRTASHQKKLYDNSQYERNLRNIMDLFASIEFLAKDGGKKIYSTIQDGWNDFLEQIVHSIIPEIEKKLHRIKTTIPSL